MAASTVMEYRKGANFFGQINRIFNTKQIDEFDVIPSGEPLEKDGSLPFVVHDSKLGLMSWCVKDLFCFAYKELMNLRRKQEGYLQEVVHVLDLSRVALILNAEDYTVWNIRKQCIVADNKLVEPELAFSSLVLSKHPRSSETFSHRRWLINYLRAPEDNGSISSIFLTNELEMCLSCASRYCDNYTAWSHRCWLVREFMEDNVTMLLTELQNTEQYLWKHVSDNCVFYYRQFLLQRLETLCVRKKIEKLVVEEAEITSEIITRYPGHETVWYHRRFLVSHWLTIYPACASCLCTWVNKKENNESWENIVPNGRPLPVPAKQTCCYCDALRNETSEELTANHENIFCQQLIAASMAGGKPPEVERQSHLAKSHLQWLEYFLKKKLR